MSVIESVLGPYSFFFAAIAPSDLDDVAGAALWLMTDAVMTKYDSFHDGAMEVQVSCQTRNDKRQNTNIWQLVCLRFNGTEVSAITAATHAGVMGNLFLKISCLTFNRSPSLNLLINHNHKLKPTHRLNP